MLAKKYKFDLRSQGSFFKSAQKISLEGYSIFWKQIDQPLQFQVTIARGAALSAVERNSLKRSVYDICGQFVEEFSTLPLAIVIKVEKNKRTRNTTQLVNAIQQVLETHS